MYLLRRSTKELPLFKYQQKRTLQCVIDNKPKHLICFKQWTAGMVLDVISSAMHLKWNCRDTRLKRMNVLQNAKIMILQEVNEPLLNIAVSKAATFLGAYDVTIVDKLIWDQDHMGGVFSLMADVIFVSTMTHMCIQRFADQSTVPVMCMRSRTHASVQALATVMSIIEEYGTMRGVNIAYYGPPHPVLNSYLLLCPMLGANIRFKCCCQKIPISPLLFKASEEMTAGSLTECKQCKTKEEVLAGACVVIAGPTTTKKDKIQEFTFGVQDIAANTCARWIFFHTCPRGDEVDDCLFNHDNARTLDSFENMQFVAAALMTKAVIGTNFNEIL